MLGLGGYASSNEEDEEPNDVSDAQTKTSPRVHTKAGRSMRGFQATLRLLTDPLSSAADRVTTSRIAPDHGPAPGPSLPLEGFDCLDYDEPTPELSYEHSRESIRNLTMPSTPNFNIPPSPPGSPPPDTNKKFANFLKLKKQGVHFNERLANTPALKNPTLLEKLKQHAGVGEEEQYATTLSSNLAVPTSYPPWAYADELNKAQSKLRQKRENDVKRKGRDAVEFVPASASGLSSRTSTPRGTSQSAAERVLGGLDNRPQQAAGRKR